MRCKLREKWKEFRKNQLLKFDRFKPGKSNLTTGFILSESGPNFQITHTTQVAWYDCHCGPKKSQEKSGVNLCFVPAT